jgi:exopolyphosphatase/guanosine-5'-triphosphate,3'-diphosphate pyrophosphatase
MATNLQAQLAVRRVAALDLGTNSLRVLVADCASDGSYRVLDDEKFACRLGAGLSASGRLSEEAIGRTMEGLRRAVGIARGYNAERIQAVATSAVREATNGEAFLLRVKSELDLELSTISGEEEARLAYLSLRRHFDLSAEPAIVLDLGGGSLEVVVTAGGDLVEDIVSLPLGAVVLTEHYLPDPEITAGQYRALRKAVQGQLARLADYRGQGHRVYGSGGSLTALARMLLTRRSQPANEVMGFEILRPDLRHLRETLRSLPLEARRAVPGLRADRVDIIVAAAVVVEETLRILGAEGVIVNAQGIREGILVRLMEELFPGSPGQPSAQENRERGVRAFARSCGYEEAHAELVRELSWSLLEQLGPPEGADPAEARVLLEAAALLHDIGYLVRYKGHHKHAAHLISHAELAGFTPRQARLVALIARFHTGKAPKKSHSELATLSRSDRRLVRHLAGILRVADALDRCHCQRVTKLSVARDDEQVAVTITATTNPELELWAAQRKADLLAKVLRAEVTFVAA